jgi:hypothetical protein
VKPVNGKPCAAARSGASTAPPSTRQAAKRRSERESGRLVTGMRYIKARRRDRVADHTPEARLSAESSLYSVSQVRPVPSGSLVLIFRRPASESSPSGGKGRFWPKADCLLSGFYAANWTLTLRTRSAAFDPEQTFGRAHFPGEDAFPDVLGARPEDRVDIELIAWPAQEHAAREVA